jgi:hypothetical protein
VSHELRHRWPSLGFFVAQIDQWETRYFNGRKYRVYRRIEHYVHPRAHAKNWSQHTVMVFTESRRYNTLTTRFTDKSW